MIFFLFDFDLFEFEEVDLEWQLWWQVLDDELFVLFFVLEMLVFIEYLVFGLFGVVVYSDGVEFWLEGWLCWKGLLVWEWNDLCVDFVGYSLFGGFVYFVGWLWFGFVFGDGEKVLVEGFLFFGGDDFFVEQEGYILLCNSGGVGGGFQGYLLMDCLWFWFFLLEGLIEFVMQWLVFGVEECCVVFDGFVMWVFVFCVQCFWS